MPKITVQNISANALRLEINDTVAGTVSPVVLLTSGTLELEDTLIVASPDIYDGLFDKTLKVVKGHIPTQVMYAIIGYDAILDRLEKHNIENVAVHNVGTSQVASLDDLLLDFNLSANVQDTITKKHIHTYSEVDMVEAVDKRHDHDNKTLLDAYTQTDADLIDAVSETHDGAAQDSAIDGKLDSAKLVAYASDAGAGGAASEALTVTGLSSTDTILAVTQKVAGASNTALTGYNTLIDNGLTIEYTANPGAGSIVTVLVKKSN